MNKQEKSKSLVKNESTTDLSMPSISERFMNKVISLFFSNKNQKVQLTNFQKKLINNYFVKIDSVLKESEIKRLSKSLEYRDSLEYSWNNVDMNKLANDVVAYSEIGLDPLQSNHINIIPYKDNKTNKFEMGFIIGYNGMEIKAIKYGINVPDNAVIELVFSTDEFRQIKKDANNPIETYIFNVTNEFDRGELKGGFYYHIFNDDQTKNKLVVMNVKEIEKRKPKYAAPEFWGGEKDKYEGGKKVGKETIEGWYHKMCYKTIKRACWNEINIDPEKIDSHLLRMLNNEQKLVSMKVKMDIEENANKEIIDIEIDEVINEEKYTVDMSTGEIKEDPKDINDKKNQKPLF